MVLLSYLLALDVPEYYDPALHGCCFHLVVVFGQIIVVCLLVCPFFYSWIAGPSGTA